MATAQILCVGTMHKGSTVLRAVPAPAPPSQLRLAELLEWQVEADRELPLPADLILWLEDHGFVVDLLTGCTERMVPLQQLIDEALDTEDYEEDMLDREFWRSGQW